MKRICALAVLLLAASPSDASNRNRASPSNITAQIEADVAQIVEGINSRDIDKATRFDAPDLVSMESMRAPSFGSKANRDGLSMVFKYAPSWHVSLIDQAVDVATSGDMAVYRSTYNEDSMRDGIPYTHKVNYIAGFRRDADGMWRIHWSVVSWQSPSQRK